MASIRVISPCYLSNEFAAIKETILLLFVNEAPSRADLFLDREVLRTVRAVTGSQAACLTRLAGCQPAETTLAGYLPNPSAARGIRGGFAGEMQMFENRAAEAEK
jgi:hypothetical protein